MVLRRGVKTDVNTANDNWMEIFIFQGKVNRIKEY